MWLSPFFTNALLLDIVALFINFIIVAAWLRLNDLIAERRWLPQVLTRKLVHIGTGPIFLLAWNFFSDAWHARWLAALVPAAVLVQFLLIHLPGLVQCLGALPARPRAHAGAAGVSVPGWDFGRRLFGH